MTPGFYYGLEWKVVWRLMMELAKELLEVQDILCNSNCFIIFHTVILQHAKNFKGAQVIRWCIMMQLDD